MQLLAGLALAAAISYASYLTRSLTRSGAVAAACVGTVVFGLGGWRWAVLLLAFFVTSSLLSQGLRRRTRGTEERYAKGSQRDAGQVLGNGGIAGLWVLAHAAWPQSSWPWIGYAGALAAVTADTWATELGALSSRPPRLITRWRERVQAGASGGVSVLGLLAAGAGAGGIAAAAIRLGPGMAAGAFWTVLLAGFIGSLLDSLLGASAQAIYFCPVDRVETEQHPRHRCGSATIHVRGWRWLNNDAVNTVCGATGSVLSCLLVVGLGA